MRHAMTGLLLDVSIVLHRPDPDILTGALASLDRAAAKLAAVEGGSVRLWIIDNTEEPRPAIPEQTIAAGGFDSRLGATVLAGHGNLGYGGGHNLALGRGTAPYCLILNYDLVLAPDALVEGLRFLRAHPDVALLSPAVFNAAGEQESIAKRDPALVDLALRGFAPARLKDRFARRLARYEMRDIIGAEAAFGIPCAGGAFMLMPRPILSALGGFDERFFLYFEDFDLTKRASRLGRVAYVPSVRIVHYGGGAARKGWKHRKLFIASAWRYFAKHGFRFA